MSTILNLYDIIVKAINVCIGLKTTIAFLSESDQN